MSEFRESDIKHETEHTAVVHNLRLGRYEVWGRAKGATHSKVLGWHEDLAPCIKTATKLEKYHHLF